jgi:hypothetical protein
MNPTAILELRLGFGSVWQTTRSNIETEQQKRVRAVFLSPIDQPCLLRGVGGII